MKAKKINRLYKNRFATKTAKMEVQGRYDFVLKRADGTVEQWSDYNIVTNEGINKLLNVGAGLASQIANWYVGVFEGVYTPVAGDTAATFPASATETTAYAEAARPGWSPVASTAKSLTNATAKATFTFTAAKTIQGAFVSSVSTKGATTGTLLSAANFSAAKSVGLGDQLQVTYVLNMTSA